MERRKPEITIMKSGRSGMERALLVAFAIFMVFVAVFYAYVFVHIKIQREAEAIERSVTKARLASTQLLWAATDHVRSKAHDPDELALRSTSIQQLRAVHRTFKKSVAALKEHFDATADAGRIGLTRWLWVQGFSTPPADVAAIWTDGGAAAEMPSLLKVQERLCLEICLKKGATTEDKLEAVHQLRDLVVERLEPRFAELKRRAEMWRQRSQTATKFALRLSVLSLVAISVFVLLQYLLPMANRVAQSRRIRDHYSAMLEAQVRDRTQRLKKALAAAEAGSRSKTAFLKTISHETRTPLNGILGAAAILDDPRVPEDLREFVRIIDESGAVMASFMENTVEMADLAADGVRLCPQPTDLAALAETVCTNLRQDLSKRGVAFDCDVASVENARYLVDPSRLAQVMTALLDNAQRNTKSGFIALTISARDDPKESELIIEVGDSGVGMPEEEQKRIFSRFSRLSETENNLGAGLGLSICRTVIEAMDGSIDVWSRPGLGSIFTVRFKAKRADAAPRAVA